MQKNGSLPENKLISVELSKKTELKKYMKRVMPFVQATRQKIEDIGLQALNLTLEFDEMDVLAKNLVYLENTLDVSTNRFELRRMGKTLPETIVFKVSNLP